MIVHLLFTRSFSIIGGSRHLKREVQCTVPTGKYITRHDLVNITRKATSDRTDLEYVVELLKANGFSTTIVEDDGEVCGVYFSDSFMKEKFEKFPEICLVDSTYKLVDTRFPVFVLMNIDGMGHSHVVGMFLVTSETEHMIKTMLQVFKSENGRSCTDVRVFMTDKDAALRSVIRSLFPQSSLQLCLFHVLRSFRREVTVGANLTKQEKDRALHVLQSLVHASDEEAYDRLRDDLSPRHAREYFDANWHNIRHEWVLALMDGGLFGTNTNNRLENFNGKLKSVCRLQSSFPDFVLALTALLSAQRRDRSFDVHQAQNKRPVVRRQNDLGLFPARLTPFAFKAVEAQFEQMQKVELNRNGSEYIGLTYSGRHIEPTPHSCQCSFFRKYMLPCRHVLKVRALLSMSLFEDSLVHRRWMVDSQQMVGNPSPSPQIDLMTAPRRTRCLTQHERFRQSTVITNQIASLGSELTGVDINLS